MVRIVIGIDPAMKSLDLISTFKYLTKRQYSSQILFYYVLTLCQLYVIIQEDCPRTVTQCAFPLVIVIFNELHNITI